MKGKLLKGLLATAVFAVPVTFWACGTSSTSSNSNVGTASLNLSAKFKGKDGINAQFLSQDISCIEYHLYMPLTDTSLSGAIGVNNPSTTINNLPVSYGKLYLIATDGQVDGDDCDGNEIDRLYAHINLAEGTNTFTATMIGHAKWEFVDDQNNPTPIVLNKTNPNSNETLNYFNLFNEYGDIHDSSIDETKPSFFTNYKVMFKGSNLPTNENCQSSDVCYTYGQYFVQFIGPNTSNNAFNTWNISLSPYTDTQTGKVYEREALIVGVTPGYPMKLHGYFGTGGNIGGYGGYNGYSGYGGYDGYSGYDGYGGYGGYSGYNGYGGYGAYDGYGGYYGYGGYISHSFELTQNDGTDVIDDIKQNFGFTTVTASDTMEGILIEVATDTSSEQENATCYYDEEKNSPLPSCPSGINEMSKQRVIIAALQKAQNGISAQGIDNNNCYMNTNISSSNLFKTTSGSLKWMAGGCQNVDIDNDGQTEYVCDYDLDGALTIDDDTNNDGIINEDDSVDIYIDYEYTATLNICVHPFTAKAGEIPSSDINLTIQ